ncbi:MAG TPA: DUF1801 domain-containing protein [Candidatus Dormibacteraeota bacterium]|jgi:uncharacterized protein YdhG (YjbR/CyaY superfamily)|nr:DUF1801 domain-containing protein [Candidatus Dormibacteraeota bacterium]
MPAAKTSSKKTAARTGTQDVDAYIAAAPKPVQPRLRKLRALIKAAVPSATERISYQIPYYDYHGRLTYFAAFKDHISFFIPGAATDAFARELKPYRKPRTSKATISLPLDQPLPEALITKLVKARRKELEPK